VVLVASCPIGWWVPRLDDWSVQGVSVVVCDCSLSALHEAAACGHLELTQVLIEHGAAVDVHDNEGCCDTADYGLFTAVLSALF